VASLEAAVAAARRPALVEPFKASAERFLHDLRGTLQTNTDKARLLLARALDRIVLQCEGSSLVAHFYGSVAGVLQITDQEMLTARAGAGSPSHIVPYHRVQVSRLPPPHLRRR
jgi:hypothetical protein